MIYLFSKTNTKQYLQSSELLDKYNGVEELNSQFWKYEKKYNNHENMQLTLSTISNTMKISLHNETVRISDLSNKENLTQKIKDSQYYYDVEKVSNDLDALEFVGYRKISGDGNCFYRALMFSIIEDCVTCSNLAKFKALLIDIDEILSSSNFTKFMQINGKGFIIKYDSINQLLFIIYKMTKRDLYVNNHLMLTPVESSVSEEQSMRRSLDLLKFGFNLLEDFDLAMLGYTKIKIYEYINYNEDKYFSENFDVKIGNLLPAEFEDKQGNACFRDFYYKFLLKLHKEAEKVIVYITPFTFNIGVGIAIIEPSKINFQTFTASTGSSESSPSICFLYRESHYELFYLKRQIKHEVGSEMKYFTYEQTLQNIKKSNYDSSDFNNIFETKDYENSKIDLEPQIIEQPPDATKSELEQNEKLINDILMEDIKNSTSLILEMNKQGEEIQKDSMIAKYIYFLQMSKQTYKNKFEKHKSSASKLFNECKLIRNYISVQYAT